MHRVSSLPSVVSYQHDFFVIKACRTFTNTAIIWILINSNRYVQNDIDLVASRLGLLERRTSSSLLHRGFYWLCMTTISIEILSLHFTWRILEHERSRWAKERRWGKNKRGLDPSLALIMKIHAYGTKAFQNYTDKD